jgi:hypothetical protein
LQSLSPIVGARHSLLVIAGDAASREELAASALGIPSLKSSAVGEASALKRLPNTTATVA